MVVVEMVMATGPQKLARALLDNHIIFLRRGRLWLRMMPSFRHLSGRKDEDAPPLIKVPHK